MYKVLYVPAFPSCVALFDASSTYLPLKRLIDDKWPKMSLEERDRGIELTTLQICSPFQSKVWDIMRCHMNEIMRRCVYLGTLDPLSVSPLSAIADLHCLRERLGSLLFTFLK